MSDRLEALLDFIREPRLGVDERAFAREFERSRHACIREIKAEIDIEVGAARWEAERREREAFDEGYSLGRLDEQLGRERRGKAA